MIYKNKHGNKIFKSRESTLLEVEYTNIQAGESRFQLLDDNKITYMYQLKQGGSYLVPYLFPSPVFITFYGDGTLTVEYFDTSNVYQTDTYDWYVNGSPSSFPYTIAKTGQPGSGSLVNSGSSALFTDPGEYTITGADSGSVTITFS